MLRERLIAIAATLPLLLGCPWTCVGKDRFRFDPARVVSIAQTMYPDGGTVSGTVILEAMVGRSGRVGTIQVVQGPPKLTEAAERSVREWKFRPAKFAGAPLASPMVVSFIFSDLPPAQCSRF